MAGFSRLCQSVLLTGYDNTDAVSGMPDEEVFVYDAQDARLVCASCNPTGAAPERVCSMDSWLELLVDRVGAWTGQASRETDVEEDHWLAGSVPGWDDLNADSATYQPRYLLNDGRLFFDSPDGLVAHDTNGLEDVYEFEPENVGGCSSGTASATSVFVKEVAGHAVDGCVGLLSSGTSSSESAFYDASEDGDDVFFDTTSKLVSSDFDNGYDVYDAHVCSSEVPCVQGPVLVPPCESGDACKAAPSPQPAIFGPPPSATFNGVGNQGSVPVVVKKSLTNAQKLAAALKVCHKKKARKQRSVCERQARKRYPVKHAPTVKRAPKQNRKGR